MINKMRIPESTLTREKVLEENKRVHKLEDIRHDVTNVSETQQHQWDS